MQRKALLGSPISEEKFNRFTVKQSRINFDAPKENSPVSLNSRNSANSGSTYSQSGDCFHHKTELESLRKELKLQTQETELMTERLRAHSETIKIIELNHSEALKALVEQQEQFNLEQQKLIEEKDLLIKEFKEQFDKERKQMHDSKDKLKLKVLNLMQRLQQAELSLKEMG